MSKKRQATFKLKMKIPEDCTEKDVQEYVKEALETWCKSYFPGDAELDPHPWFNMDEQIISIERTAR